jgi:hypothetical protein
MALVLLDYYVLDALADDIESLAQIMPSVERAAELWAGDVAPSDVTRQAVVTSLLRLIKECHVRTLALASSGKGLEELPERLAPSGSFDDYWFSLTSRGRLLHSGWVPPPGRA